MAMTGGIGYEIDQLTELGVPELVRRQSEDPQLKYALALQQATKLVEAAVRERDMAQKMPESANLIGQMETSLAKRLAPGVQMQGQRSMQMQNRVAMGLPAQAAPNLTRIASGGIVGYQEGGDVEGKSTQVPMMGDENQRRAPYLDPALEKFLIELEALNAQKDAAFPQEKDLFEQKIQDLIDTTSPRVKRLASDSAFGLPKKSGMAMGGIVGYKKGGEIDIDALLDSLMMAESGGNPRAVSSAGAEGAYQIMPATAANPGFGVSPMEGSRFDPEASRKFAKQYLQAMLDRYDGDVEAALVAYNAGPGNADKFVAAGKDYDVLPMAMQTKPYVERVMGKMPQEDAGTKIDVRPGESYSQARRRTDQERANRALAARYATVPEKQETEMYEPNIGDALAVAEAQTKLRGGPEMNVGERDPRFSDPANYLRDMGAKQEDDNRTRFAQAFPKAEKAVADYAEDKKLGGLGALRTMGRLQESRRNAFSQAFPKAAQAAADYAADKEMGGIGALRVAGRLQAQREANEMAEAQRAVDYLKQQAQMQQMLESIDPAADVQNFNEGGGVAGFLRNLIAPERESLEGVDLSVVSEENPLAEPRMTPSELIEPFKDDPVGATANLILGAYGGAKILGMTGKALQPVVKKYGPAAVQRAKDLAAKTVTTPKMSGPGSAVRGPKGKMMSAEKAREAGVPLNRQFSPGRTAVTGALGVKAADYFMDEEFPVAPTDVTVPTEADIFRRDAPAALVSAIDANEGEQAALRAMFPDAPEMTAQERTAERARIARGGGDRPTRRSAGLAGLLDKIGGTQGLLNIAETLGRGAGASKGFEAAKIVEESAKARAAQEARQDQLDKLREQLEVEREKIGATTAVAESKALAALNKEQREVVGEFLTLPTTQARIAELQEELGAESAYDPRVLAALQPDITAYLNIRGMAGSVGGMPGLPEGVTVKRVN